MPPKCTTIFGFAFGQFLLICNVLSIDRCIISNDFCTVLGLVEHIFTNSLSTISGACIINSESLFVSVNSISKSDCEQ